jgi:hypothetical protein
LQHSNCGVHHIKFDVSYGGETERKDPRLTVLDPRDAPAPRRVKDVGPFLDGRDREGLRLLRPRSPGRNPMRAEFREQKRREWNIKLDYAGE